MQVSVNPVLFQIELLAIKLYEHDLEWAKKTNEYGRFSSWTELKETTRVRYRQRATLIGQDGGRGYTQAYPTQLG